MLRVLCSCMFSHSLGHLRPYAAWSASGCIAPKPAVHRMSGTPGILAGSGHSPRYKERPDRQSVRHCQINLYPAGGAPGRNTRSRCGNSIPPQFRGLDSENPERRARDKMALKVEGVVDGGVHAEKTLGGARRLKALHFVLSSSHRLM